MSTKAPVRRKPRLPDRLLKELAAQRGKAVGGRRGADRLTRRERRSAARLEKKRKKSEHFCRRRERLKKRRQTPKESAPNVPVRGSAPEGTRLAKAAGTEGRVEAASGGEDVSGRRAELQRAFEEEKKRIVSLNKKLGRASEENSEWELDGLLNGFNDAHVQGIPDQEFHPERDSDTEDAPALEQAAGVVKGSNRQPSPTAVFEAESEEVDEIPVLRPMAGAGTRGTAGKYVPPALRTAEKSIQSSAFTAKQALVGRRMRGLLNRISEDNIKSIVEEITQLCTSMGRNLVSRAMADEITQATAKGPKATELFVGIAAAAVSAVCCRTGSHEISADFLHCCAVQLEQCYEKEDRLGTLNTLGLFCHLYLCGLTASDLLYGLLRQLTDLDITVIYHLLAACGLRLRSDDPLKMREFVTEVHNKAAEQSRLGALSQRAEIMLDLVIDIKNNQLTRSGKRESFKKLSPVLAKWLQQMEVTKMTLANLTWEKVTSPNKTGQWWLPDTTDIDRDEVSTELFSGLADPGNGSELLSLAVQQRMNTGVRKAIFCTVMGAQDVLDACEKLLRLPLKGEQDREVVRVLLDCCLQERRWNPFYSAVAGRLCQSKKSHAITLKFCILDKLKAVEEMEVRAMDHMAKFLAEILHKEVLPIGILKGVDLTPGLSGKILFFWRIFLTQLLLKYRSTDALLEAFSKLAHSETLQSLAQKLLVFIKYRFRPWLRKDTSSMTPENQRTLLQRLESLQSLLKSFHSI